MSKWSWNSRVHMAIMHPFWWLESSKLAPRNKNEGDVVRTPNWVLADDWLYEGDSSFCIYGKALKTENLRIMMRRKYNRKEGMIPKKKQALINLAVDMGHERHHEHENVWNKGAVKGLRVFLDMLWWKRCSYRTCCLPDNDDHMYMWASVWWNHLTSLNFVRIICN